MAVTTPPPVVPRPAARRPTTVQRPLRRTAEGARRRRLESLAVFLVSAAAFGVLGYWVVTELHVVGFDALDRLARAMMVWRNDPPKLAAIGFAVPPLTTVALLPLAVVRDLGATLVALPVCSALFGGVTMVAVNRALARSGFGAVRFLVLALVAANPVVAFAAASGSADIVGAALLTAALASLVTWYATVDARYLVAGGVAFSFAVVATYAALLWLVAAAAVVGVTLLRHRAEDREVEGSLILFLTPGLFAVGLWVLFNLLVLGEPFAWLGEHATTTVNAASSSPVGTSVGGVIGQTVELVAAASPLTFVVLPALVACAVAQRNELAAWLAGFLLLAVLTPAVEALVRDDETKLALHDGLPLVLATVVGIAWLHRSLVSARPLVATLAVAGLAVSLPLGWQAMADYPYQSMEQAFQRAVRTGDDQEGTTSRGGLQVGLLSERAMADYLLHQAPGRVLTDNAQTFGVIALTGRPGRFLDRADHGDGRWRKAAANPPPDVDYLLFAKDAPADGLRRLHPRIAAGRDPRYPTVFDTPRYRLVAVPATTTPEQP